MGVYIYGSGGHGKVIFDTLLCNGLDIDGFLDDGPLKYGTYLLGKPIIGGFEILKEEDCVYLGIGDNTQRQTTFNRCVKSGIHMPKIVHPTSFVSSLAFVGDGSIILANSVVNTCANIGVGCIINSCAILEHDCIMENFSHMCPNSVTGGGVKIGERAMICVGASIKPRVLIGKNSIVGAGSVVIRDVEDNKIFVGNPARYIKDNI